MSDALFDAIQTHGVDRLAKLLAAGADPNTRFTSYRGVPGDITALHVAVAELPSASQPEPRRSVDAVVLLLRHGGVVNCYDDPRETTPLLTAVIIKHIEAVRLLLAAGADPNVCDAEGDSPLRFCAQEGLLDMARLLLHCGAGKTIDEGGGSTGMNALGLAAYGLHVDMVRLLLAHGANPQAWDLDKRTPLDRLRRVSPPDPADQERLREIRRLLGAPEPTAPTSNHNGKEE